MEYVGSYRYLVYMSPSVEIMLQYNKGELSLLHAYNSYKAYNMHIAVSVHFTKSSLSGSSAILYDAVL